MSKRVLSSAPLPVAKRQRNLFLLNSETQHPPIINFDDTLYDELVLSIFSHLSWVDLCVIQTTSKNWSRLAADNELWRNLYLRVYGRSRLRGARGHIGRADGREVKPLPGRATADDYKDWKWMFRISSNWRRGRCTVEQLHNSPPHALSAGSPEEDEEHESESMYILLTGSLTITASSRRSRNSTIHLRGVSGPGHTLICRSTRDPSHQITALALDQSPPVAGHIRLASFLSSGEFVVFSVNHLLPLASSRKVMYIPTRRNARTSPIIRAVYHHPLLITLSKAFHFSIYDLSSDNITHMQTLSSFTSFPPSSLVLSTPSPTTYKLVLAYATPVYPAHWSVGATELIIAGVANATAVPPTSPSSTQASTAQAFLPPADSLSVISTRTTRTFDVPQGWIDERKLFSMREQWSRKVVRVSDIQTDGKWVVLAPGPPLPLSSRPSSSNSPPLPTTSSLHSPTSLQLYRLSFPSGSNSVSSAPPKLSFVRTLHGQIGPVTGLALADGRCVSLGLNGSVWVWDLEVGTETEVTGPELELDHYPMDDGVTGGSVIFDERRIITALAGKVVVRRFDI